MPLPLLKEKYAHIEPLLVVISGPSGVGKDTVVSALKARQVPFHFVVTTTDRAARENEVNGRDYHFVSTKRFEEMIASDELLEHAVVYGQNKGVSRAEVRGALASGKDVVMRLDVQGAFTIREKCRDAVLIFLVPDSEEGWVQRLRERRTETEEQMQHRLATGKTEMDCIEAFDYLVINAQGRLEDTLDAIEAIICAEHLRVHQRKITL